VLKPFLVAHDRLALIDIDGSTSPAKMVCVLVFVDYRGTSDSGGVSPVSVFDIQYRRLRVGHRPIPTGLNNEFNFRFFSSHK